MARPLRIEFAGAVYHVTSRGDRREPIYVDDTDRQSFLGIVAHAMERFDAQVLAYCLMDNHYHLVLHTRQGNLSRVMRHLNGVYTQHYNRRHGLTGHIFQGRFKAILVDRDAYLLTLCRYVERNPVAAGLVEGAGDWAWSSYGAHVGAVPTPAWLDTEGLHGYVLGRDPETARDRATAARAYAGLVQKRAAEDANLWKTGLRKQIYLGSEEFAADTLKRAAIPSTGGRESARRPRQPPPRTTAEWIAETGDRAEGLRMAFREGALTMTAMAREIGLSVSRVSRLIADAEARVARSVGEDSRR